MKLAEALQERADLNRRIAQIRSRLINNALKQEGETPAEEPAELLAELENCTEQLESVIAAINRANCRTQVDGRSLTELIARKDCLTLKIQSYHELIAEASRTAYRATRSEIKILSSVNVKELQKTADLMAKELRQLDNLIQQTNWLTDI